MLITAFSRRYAGNNLRAVIQRTADMKCCLGTGNTLAEHFGIFIDQN